MGKTKGRRATSLFRKAASATTYKRPNFSRGASKTGMDPGGQVAVRGMNVLLVIAVLVGVLAILFIFIPKVVDNTPERGLPVPANPSAPTDKK